MKKRRRSQSSKDYLKAIYEITLYEERASTTQLAEYLDITPASITGMIQMEEVFVPEENAVYPIGFSTTVEVSGLTEGLCGRFRPGHFTGVTTVVAKLFNLVQPDVAVFGEKDYQQLTLVRRLVRDFDLPVAIVGVPTVRESDGLARSSRNRYLSPQQRQVALGLAGALRAGVDAATAGVSADEVLAVLSGRGYGKEITRMVAIAALVLLVLESLLVAVTSAPRSAGCQLHW